MTKAAKAGRCEKAIREYFGGVLDGSITACRKIKQVAAKILRDMDNKDPLYPYHSAKSTRASTLTSLSAFAAYHPASLGTLSSWNCSNLPFCP